MPQLTLDKLAQLGRHESVTQEVTDSKGQGSVSTGGKFFDCINSIPFNCLM